MDKFEFDEESEETPPKVSRKRIRKDSPDRKKKKRKKMKQTKLKFLSDNSQENFNVNSLSSHSQSETSKFRKKKSKKESREKFLSKRKNNSSQPNTSSRKWIDTRKSKKKLPLKKKKALPSSSSSSESESSSSNSSSSSVEEKKRIVKKKKSTIPKNSTVIVISSSEEEEDTKKKTSKKTKPKKIQKFSNNNRKENSKKLKKKRKSKNEVSQIASFRPSYFKKKEKSKTKKVSQEAFGSSFSSQTSNKKKKKSNELTDDVYAKEIYNVMKVTKAYGRIISWLKYHQNEKSGVKLDFSQKSRRNKKPLVNIDPSTCLFITSHSGCFSTLLLREIIKNNSSYEIVEMQTPSNLSFDVLKKRESGLSYEDFGQFIPFDSILRRLENFIDSPGGSIQFQGEESNLPSQKFNIAKSNSLKDGKSGKIRIVGGLPKPSRPSETIQFKSILSELAKSLRLSNNAPRKAKKKRRSILVLIHWIYDTKSVEDDMNHFYPMEFLRNVNRIDLPRISEHQTKKIIRSVLQKTRKKMRNEEIENIAKSSKGDILNVVERLKFFLVLGYNQRSEIRLENTKRLEEAGKVDLSRNQENEEIISIDGSDEEKEKNRKISESVNFESIKNVDDSYEHSEWMDFDDSQYLRNMKHTEKIDNDGGILSETKDRTIACYQVANKLLSSEKLIDSKYYSNLSDSNDLLLDYIFHNYLNHEVSFQSDISESLLNISEIFSFSNTLGWHSKDFSRIFSELMMLPNYEFIVTTKIVNSTIVKDKAQYFELNRKKRKNGQVRYPQNRTTSYHSRENWKIGNSLFRFFSPQFGNAWNSNMSKSGGSTVDEKTKLLCGGMYSKRDIFVDVIPFLRNSTRVLNNIKCQDFISKNMKSYYQYSSFSPEFRSFGAPSLADNSKYDEIGDDEDVIAFSDLGNKGEEEEEEEEEEDDDDIEEFSD